MAGGGVRWLGGMRHVRTGRQIGAVLAGAGIFGLGISGLAGCASGTSPGASGTSCGAARTAVNVPVTITVAKGPVDCGTALRVERGYAKAIKDGDLRGNGGGAPVAVNGWTCQTYPTSMVLRTGDASECHTASAEVVAVLALPSASPGS
jgi:hypothetical protein